MLKRKNARKKFDALKTNGVNIKCCYCDAREECKTRGYKEESEEYGFKTYCTLTPNRTKKFLKTKSKRRG